MSKTRGRATSKQRKPKTKASTTPISEAKKAKKAKNTYTPSVAAVRTNDAPPFPIVGIGASAGGLEAITAFLDKAADCGMAFVVVQHLDPNHKGLMPELLQRTTKLKVKQVKDGMRLQPNAVYIIPPNKDMSILRGVLHLFHPTRVRGLRLPIDFFFRALAEDQRDRSIAVVLSGMGTDGTLGLKAIKEAGGMVLVQDPTQAKFDGMPRSAIDTGLVDVTAFAEELFGKLQYCIKRQPSGERDTPDRGRKPRSGLDKAIILLRAHTGHDFSLYKKPSMYRRIERRMHVHRIENIAHYVRYLQENPQERELLFRELLIGVTAFFRDPQCWESLLSNVLPELLAKRASSGQIRAWVPGCSTGEEAYSLAIVLREALERSDPDKRHDLQIFATDLDRDAIDRARQAVYPPNIAADVSAERLRCYFTKTTEGNYALRKEIRKPVTLAPQNVIMDPPFTKLDIIVCRNLLIYLTPELQKKLMSLFYYCLNPGGILFLGSAETADGSKDLFVAAEPKWRIYRRNPTTAPLADLDFPSSFTRTVPHASPQTDAPATPQADLSSLAGQALLQLFAPAAVLVNDSGDIVYISGRTGKYLEPAAGKANWNIFAMAREGLRSELTLAMQRVARGKGPVTCRNLVFSTEAGKHAVDLTVQALDSPEALKGLRMVVFSHVNVPTGKPTKRSTHTARQKELERELLHLREELQDTREEAQTAQEELKSANEELQSTNEELQSTNEELTTSKEELQSLNEELQTVNNELQAKVDELSSASSDMKNLLDSTHIATLFLDNRLRIRRFTSQAAKIISLIPSDVGRPITDISSSLVYPDLTKDVEDVLRTLTLKEREVPTRKGSCYATRIMPYRTVDNVIDGVVITFLDISVAKELVAKLQKSRDKEGARADAATRKMHSAEQVFKEKVRRRRRAEDVQPCAKDIRPRAKNGSKRK